MATSTFKTNPEYLNDLLKDCHTGKLQLPDFQRSWVWDEDRIKSLIASISRSFPVGALMTLETGGFVDFRPRLVEGAPSISTTEKPDALLLDGQQRMTSLYQVTMRNQVVVTKTPKGKPVKRWFYIDMEMALDPSKDRELAIVGIPVDKIIRSNFGKSIELDLTTREQEFEHRMFPLSMIFNWGSWQSEWIGHVASKQPDRIQEVLDFIKQFKDEIIDAFEKYQLPVIELDKGNTKEAVCTVFEKVNTGGKPLDAFELITAIYSADGYELRKDWYGDSKQTGRHSRLTQELKLPGAKTGILEEVSSTDFLHVVSLFHTRERREIAEKEGKSGKDLPQVSGNRAALLNLPLDAYKKYQDLAETGFNRAAKFLHLLRIYRKFDLPYQSQIIPLAAVLASIGDTWEHTENHAKLVEWYWCGVFGELYGSTTETRIARDFIEIPIWLTGGDEPTTVKDCSFRADRLKTMRMRLSAAYKGVNTLLMLEGAHDLRTGQSFDHTIFFGENVDIHHIFPQKWCTDHHISSDVFNSIINKTPLSYKTNRIIGGDAPSQYLSKLELGDKINPPIQASTLDKYLRSHLIEPNLIRSDDFEAFFEARQARLVSLIASATKKNVVMEHVSESEDEVEGGYEEESLAHLEESELTLAAAD